MANGCAPFCLSGLQSVSVAGLRCRVNPWELAASAFGLANIVLLARRSVWNYPCGMAMVAIFAFVFWNSRLYAVAGLQIFFFLAQAQGLWMWLRAPADEGQVAVRRLPPMGWPAVLISGAGEEMKHRPVMPDLIGLVGQGGREDVGLQPLHRSRASAKPLSGHGQCRAGKVQNRDPLIAKVQEVIHKRGGPAAHINDRRIQW